MHANDIIKIGITGCGEHSHAHARAANEVPGIKFISCCDINEKRAKEWAELYECDSYYTDIGTMIKKEKLDAVVLCTWPAQHLEQIEKCVSGGIKSILCEKSLALTGQEALSIWELSRVTKTFVMEASMYRHHPAIRKIESILSAGEIGGIDSVRAVFSNYEPENESSSAGQNNWRENKDCGGGIPYDWMSYTVNACNHFSGARPVRVYAYGNVSEKTGVIYRVYGLIEYSSGAVGMIENSKTANFSEELSIKCAKGILNLPIAWGIFDKVTINQFHRKKEWDYILTDSFEIDKANSFSSQLKNFSDVIRGDADPLIPLSESVINIHTIEAIVKSVLEKNIIQVELPELN